MIISKMQEIVGLCYEVSNFTKHKAFFNYAPHVDVITVCVYIDGVMEDTDPLYLPNMEVYEQLKTRDEESLQKIIDYLKELK